MIGSRSKRDKVYEELIAHGYGKEELAHVYSPIGTSIGAETPEELAVSIVGELIKVRAERENSKRSQRGESGACCRILAPEQAGI
jgi:xanthine dehydrogenase accessory factor